MKENAARPRREAHADFIEKFDRPEIKLGAFTSLCKRNGWLTGRTGCFPKGNVPMNKGKKMPYNANNARTQFKKGHRPHNTRQAGHEHVNVYGYVEISINERNPHTGFERRMVLKHRHLWEQQNGPVPDGHFLKCLDGNKTNCSPDNWECLPNAMKLRLAGRKDRDKLGYDEAPDELKPVIMATAKLEQAARAATKGGDQ